MPFIWKVVDGLAIKMKSDMSIGGRSKLVENGVVIGLRLLSIAVGFAYIRIYTNNLSTDQIGKYFYLVTLSYMMNALVFVPIDYYLQAKLALSGKVIPFRALVKLNKAVCLLALGLCLLVSIPLLYLQKITASDIAGIYITALLFYFCSFLRGLLNNRGFKVFVVLMLMFEGLARLGLFMLVANYTNASASSLLYSSIVAFLMETLVILFFCYKKLEYEWLQEELDDYRTVFKKSYAISISAICNLAQLQGYRLMYVWAGAPATAAVYVVVTNLGSSGMAAISSVYSQIFLPKIYASKGGYALTYIRNGLILALGAGICAAFFSEYILSFLTKNDYVEYAQAISFGVLVEAGNLVIGAATVFMMLNNTPGVLIRCNIIGATVSIVGECIALYCWPQNSFAIGVPIALSQIFIAAFLVMKIVKAKKEQK